MYKIIIKKTAAKELENLPKKILLLVTNAIYKLAEVPRPFGCKKLNGVHTTLWRIRIGDYRVIYTIDDEVKIIDVQKVGHRKDIYE